MRITVNGRPADAPDGATVADLLSGGATATARDGTAVAVNGEVVPRAAHADHTLRDGDVVDVVTAVQGG